MDGFHTLLVSNRGHTVSRRQLSGQGSLVTARKLSQTRDVTVLGTRVTNTDEHCRRRRIVTPLNFGTLEVVSMGRIAGPNRHVAESNSKDV